MTLHIPLPLLTGNCDDTFFASFALKIPPILLILSLSNWFASKPSFYEQTRENESKRECEWQEFDDTNLNCCMDTFVSMFFSQIKVRIWSLFLLLNVIRDLTSLPRLDVWIAGSFRVDWAMLLSMQLLEVHIISVLFLLHWSHSSTR